MADWPRAEVIETARLTLEPLRVEHAEAMAPLLDEPLAELRSSYARRVRGSSADGRQGWLNWIVRSRQADAVVGTVQATLRRADGVRSAELAWVVGTDHRRRGYAKEAAEAMLVWLRARGMRNFVAHVHPENAASIAVAKHLGLEPTEARADGEVRWVRAEQPRLTGGCNCGAVRYEVTEPLLRASYCHCKRCQRRSGAAASANAHPAPGSFRIVAGQDRLRMWQPDGGGEKWFCGDCGSSLFGRNPNHADPIGIRMGTFDTDPGIRPSARQFVSYAAPWEPLPDDGLPRHPESRHAAS